MDMIIRFFILLALLIAVTVHGQPVNGNVGSNPRIIPISVGNTGKQLGPSLIGIDSIGTFYLLPNFTPIYPRVDTANTFTLQQTFSGPVAFAYTTISGTDIDWAAGPNRYKQLTGDTTFTFSNVADNRSLVVLLEQDSTGGRTVTWPSGIVWFSTNQVAALSASTTAGFYTRFFLERRNGTNYGSVLASPSVFDVQWSTGVASGESRTLGGLTLGVTPLGTSSGGSGVSYDTINGAESTIASATTTAIGGVTSDKVSITGTTTITGFGTIAAGTTRSGRFTGALTLTHNATSLILPGAANITTAAGDSFQAVSLGSGNWVVYFYQKADGTAVVGGAGGAPSTADYLVGTANGGLSAEIVVGTAPGGELGGSWASPTLDDSLTVTGWDMGASVATTPSANDNDTSLATTAYVQTEITSFVRSSFVPVGWMEDGATAPAAITTYADTRKVDVRKFSSSAQNDLEFAWMIPVDAIDGSGTADWQMKWRPIYIITEGTAPASNEGVTFSLAGASVADAEDFGATVGTAVDSEVANLNTAHVTGDLVFGPYVELTVTGGAAGEAAVFQVFRDVADTEDDYGQLVGLVGIEIKFVYTGNATY